MDPILCISLKTFIKNPLFGGPKKTASGGPQNGSQKCQSKNWLSILGSILGSILAAILGSILGGLTGPLEDPKMGPKNAKVKIGHPYWGAFWDRF